MPEHVVWRLPEDDSPEREVFGEVELGMERLGKLADVLDARSCLSGVVRPPWRALRHELRLFLAASRVV